ncbi:BglG family transcription antiterminator [Streptococcus ovis]|uniref:BglG family transcription antiterminator n=1 Tax=Streptococcus ovis TaxID=82806 RepID=UPI0014616EF3|nr:BglG family transcription antiterminator [Streptococcus ovis]
MIDKRVSDIIHFLKRHRKGSFSELEAELEINQSQLKYSIKKLNEFLAEHDVEQIDGTHQFLFINDDQYHFLIEINELDFANDYIFNSVERLKLIFLILVAKDEEYISFAHLYELLGVGKTTISQDIKELSDLLSEEGIMLDYSRQTGYQLIGDEMAIRRHLFYWIMSDFAAGNKMIYTLYLKKYKEIELQSFISQVHRLNDSLNIRFVEDRFVEFCCFLALILKRMQHLQNCFEVTLNFDIKEMIEYQFSKNLCNYFKINSEEEILYLCSWVLGQSVGNLDYQTPDRNFILQIVYQLLRLFEKLSGIFFDNRDEVIYQLYGHLRPCYYRLLFQFPIANQLVSKIQNEYRDIYYLVNEVVKQNNQLMGQKISEDEIAYLSIHFASIIEKNGTKITSQTMKAVVVCSNGIGSSAIIFEELRNLFSDILFIGPLAIEEFRQFDITNVDLIFSTSMEKSILESKSPVFFLNPIMTVGEKYNLVRTVYEKIGRYQLPDVDKILQIIEKHTDINASDDLKKELANYLTFQQNIEKKSSEIRLSDILLPQYIQKIPENSSIEEMLDLLAEPLLNNKIIRKDYVRAVKEEILNSNNTFHIAPNILLPHTEPSNGVSDIGMSLGILETPMVINDKEITHVFFLAAVDNKKHISAMADLVKLITNSELFLNVSFHTSVEDIYTFIKRSENEL